MIGRSPQLVQYIVDNYDDLHANEQIKTPIRIIQALYNTAESEKNIEILKEINSKFRDINSKF